MLDTVGAVWREGVRAQTPITHLDSVTVTIYAILLVTAAKTLQISIAQRKVIYHINYFEVIYMYVYTFISLFCSRDWKSNALRHTSQYYWC